MRKRGMTYLPGMRQDSGEQVTQSAGVNHFEVFWFDGLGAIHEVTRSLTKPWPFSCSFV
jgi:hypothetical protein